MLTGLLQKVRAFEPRVLMALGAVAALAWGFMLLAGEVGEGELDGFDRAVLLAFRNPVDLSDPIGPPAVEEAMRDVTALGGVTLLTLTVGVAALALLLHRRGRQAAVLVGVTLAAQASSEALKAIYQRPRPSLTPHGVMVYSGSFPSGHSMVSAAALLTLATVLCSLEPRLRGRIMIFAVAGACIVLVGISRVYLGVHWPSDVLGGWALGALWALAAWVVLRDRPVWEGGTT